MTPPRTPPPSLQAMVEAYGGYDQIPPQAWAQFDKDMAAWCADVVAGVDWYEEARLRREAKK